MGFDLQSLSLYLLGPLRIHLAYLLFSHGHGRFPPLVIGNGRLKSVHTFVSGPIDDTKHSLGSLYKYTLKGSKYTTIIFVFEGGF